MLNEKKILDNLEVLRKGINQEGRRINSIAKSTVNALQWIDYALDKITKAIEGYHGETFEKVLDPKELDKLTKDLQDYLKKKRFEA